MTTAADYISKNRTTWNDKVDVHVASEFYDMKGFFAGEHDLKEIALKLLGDVKGKSILHLQCHFGKDTLALARMGAQVTGADFSDKAIEKARELTAQINAEAAFVCCDIYDLPAHLAGQFDIVFTSYGAIGWLPDMGRWAAVVAHFLKPGGRFVMAEFHPFVWMMDEEFSKIDYHYFNVEDIAETGTGTYADKDAPIQYDAVSWNHNISEVLTSLLGNGLQLKSFNEHDYSPFNCFKHTEEYEPGKFRIKHLGRKIPMVYAIEAHKPA